MSKSSMSTMHQHPDLVTLLCPFDFRLTQEAQSRIRSSAELLNGSAGQAAPCISLSDFSSAIATCLLWDDASCIRESQYFSRRVPSGRGSSRERVLTSPSSFCLRLKRVLMKRTPLDYQYPRKGSFGWCYSSEPHCDGVRPPLRGVLATSRSDRGRCPALQAREVYVV